MARERDGGTVGLMYHLSRNGHKETDVPAEYAPPSNKHFIDARKLDLSVEAIRRVMDPSLLTPKRQLTESLALRLANPHLPLEVVAQNSNLPLDLLEEDLAGVQETFQWAANRLGLGRLMGSQEKVN